MKKNDIDTLNDLRLFLKDWCELVRGICEKNGWIYTPDSEGIDYDDEDWVTDGKHILSFTSEGWELFDNNGQDIEHNGREITVREDGENWYVNFNTGLGEGVYSKADWTLEEAINDQENK